jgi:uncharacterized SAM-binding protein YcdF (DUF218 family)
MWDVGSYKPVLGALLMPPVPFLVLILVGARLILPRRGLGFALLLTGVAGVWLASCQGAAIWLQDRVLKPAAPLLGPQQTRLQQWGQTYAQQVAQARRAGRGAVPVPPMAIIVLGGGREPLAPEYGTSDLSPTSAMRLRYGVWLSRRTGLPLGFSGGVGWAQKGAEVSAPEADVAARVAEQQFGVPLRWVENASADTRANAMHTVALMAEQRVSEVVVVTSAYHMPRAQRVFEDAARQQATLHPDWPTIRVTPAATGYWRRGERAGMDWLPSAEGAGNVRAAVHECLGLLSGV